MPFVSRSAHWCVGNVGTAGVGAMILRHLSTKRAPGAGRRRPTSGVAAILLAAASLSGLAQSPVPQDPAAAGPAPVQAAAATIAVSPDYVIGPTDVLSVVFYGNQELSGEVTVRPDGKISLPLLNDVAAAGRTPEQLRLELAELATRFVRQPVVTVIVRQVNNNRAFITGQVVNPGPYVLSGPTTVLQLIAMAGGFTDFADRKHVLITRVEGATQRAFAFNYDEVVKKHDLKQNIILKPGDTVVVP